MIGQLERGEHKTLGPVLIAAYLPHQGGASAIVYTGSGLVKEVPISELSILWHYNAGKADWEPDFPLVSAAEESEA
jgi:hypothetical protein